MANYCFTDYIVEGDESERMRLGQLIESLEAEGDERQLGDLLRALGEEKKTAGVLTCLQTNGNTLSFSTYSPWQPPTKAFAIVRSHFPRLRFFYYAEESNDELFVTNDVEHKYFRLCFMEHGDQRTWFPSEQEMLEALALKLQIPTPKTIAEAEDICDEYNADGHPSFLAVRTIEVSDEDELGK